MNAQAYKITCLTNMHAGTGAADQGVIDNLVQRDTVDQIPCIYASSLKGALREYFEEYLKKENEAKKIFGNDNRKKVSETNSSNSSNTNGTSKTDDRSRGTHIFYDALLLSIPARSNKGAFFNVTSWHCLERILKMNEILGGKKFEGWIKEGNNQENKNNNGYEKIKDSFCFYELNASEEQQGNWKEELELEFWKYHSEKEIVIRNILNFEEIEKLLGKDTCIILPDQVFDILVSDYYLPVIARNQLENGVSKNLFYEQVVPRLSRFIFWTEMFPGTSSSEDKFMDKFSKKGADKTSLVQIGANASIGYGYCKIEHLASIGAERAQDSSSID